jgi:hypothetical protein
MRTGLRLLPALAENSRLLAVRDKLGHVLVKLRRRLVERSEAGSVSPRELCQISIGHLAVTNDSLGRNIGVRDIVSPEFMPRIGSGAGEDFLCRAGRLAFADEQPRQAALSDRAGREISAHADEPVLGDRPAPTGQVSGWTPTENMDGCVRPG